MAIPKSCDNNGMKARFSNITQYNEKGGNTMPILEWVALLKDKEEKLHTFRQPSPDPAIGFTSVLVEEKKGNLVSFFLDLPEQKQSIGVDLLTGHFIFSMFYRYHPAPNIAKYNPVYRLINFRRSYRDKGVGTNSNYDSGIILAYYILGWQTTIGGYNHQRIMFIDPNTLEITFKEKR